MTAIVCMATYNGARWLREQIASVVAQTDKDWQLLVSDDGSTDGTLEIIRESQRRDPRIRLLESRGDARGVVGNFEYLLAYAANLRADFIALSDQDDVWRADKLALQRQQISTAYACCSDLLLINAVGQSRGERLLSQLSATTEPTVRSLLAQNSVVGCTLAMQPQVLEIALPFPQGLENHDWWLALCALSLGCLYCDEQALVSYRQHDANIVGAYQPLRQLFKAPQLLARQRRALAVQYRAVGILQTRLVERGFDKRVEFDDYRGRLGAASFKDRAIAMAFGEFAAPHAPLRMLRVAAVLNAVLKKA